MTTVSETISPELSAGEQLLWSGQPRQGFVFCLLDVVLIPFGFYVFCAGVLHVWEFWSWHSLLPRLLMLPTVPLIVGGAYFFAGRFFVEARQRASVFYAITNKRVIIISGMIFRRVKSWDLRALPTPALLERRRGEGAVIFSRAMPLTSPMAAFWWWPGYVDETTPYFDHIANVKAVCEIAREAQRGAIG
jgi:hypothetical protein